MKILHFIETRIKTIHLETLIARWYMEFPLSNLFWSRRLEHSLHSLSLSLACSLSCQRPWQKALCSWSIQILKLTSRTLARVEWLCWSLIYNDLQQNGFARGRTQRTEQERLNIFLFFPLSHVRDEPGMSWLCSGRIRNKKIFSLLYAMGTFSGHVLLVPMSDTGTWPILACPCNIVPFSPKTP